MEISDYTVIYLFIFTLIFCCVTDTYKRIPLPYNIAKRKDEEGHLSFRGGSKAPELTWGKLSQSDWKLKPAPHKAPDSNRTQDTIGERRGKNYFANLTA